MLTIESRKIALGFFEAVLAVDLTAAMFDGVRRVERTSTLDEGISALSATR